MGNEKLKPFKKACSDDMKNPNAALKVHIYPKARQEAQTDFGWETDPAIRDYFATLAESSFHHQKEDCLDSTIYGIPKGTPFDVFHFAYKEPKDGYLAILYWNDKKVWLLKSCKKNEKSVFTNNPFYQLDADKTKVN